MELALIANGRQFRQSFLYHKTSIKISKVLGLRGGGCAPGEGMEIL